MQKLIALIVSLFYFLASNTLAHSFAMNKTQVADAGCPFHANMAHDGMESEHKDPTESKECYESCLGGFDEMSTTSVKLELTIRYDSLVTFFHTKRNTTENYTTEQKNITDKLSHGPPGPRLAAKITKKLE